MEIKGLTTRILNTLLNRLPGDLPINLMGGKTGLLLFTSLYSSLFEDERLRDISEKIFNCALKDAKYFNRSFLTGSLGFVWAVNHLKELDIIESTPNLEKDLKGILNLKPLNNIAPVYIPAPGIFYDEAITVLSFLNEEETLQRYSFQERLIGIVDDCERLLTYTIPGLYDPADMKCSFLHSMVYFLMRVNEIGIYPTKTRKIIDMVPWNKYLDSDKTVHSEILSYLRSRHLSDTINNGYSQQFAENLSLTGYYSMIYNTPKMFIEDLERRPDSLTKISKMLASGSLHFETLIGIGLGLLNVLITD